MSTMMHVNAEDSTLSYPNKRDFSKRAIAEFENGSACLVTPFGAVSHAGGVPIEVRVC